LSERIEKSAMAPIPHIDRDLTLEAVDRAIEEQENAQPERPYLGMSAIGRECARELWYGFRWCSRKAFDAATIRRFQDGHRSEAIMIERLRAVPGVTLWTEDPSGNGRQIGCVDIGGHFRGHLDGIIQGLIQAPVTPHCWEHKCTNEKKQAKLVSLKVEKGEKNALAEWDPVYFAQGQLYCHYQNLTRHYLTVDSPGSRATVSCRTDADPIVALKLIEKARRIITASEPPARLSERPDYFSCKWCDHYQICHQGAIPAVNCRTCAHSTPELDGDGRWSCARFQCDVSTETQRQGAQCPSHVFIPSALPSDWKAVDASEDQGWIEYENGLRNGPGGFASRELAANAALCVDPVVQRMKTAFDAEVVA
jgi:hypothetical protein